MLALAPKDLIKALAGTHAFCDLSDDQLTVVANLAQIRTYESGDMIVTRETRECDLLVILEGEARVLDEDGDRIADLGVGAAVGEVALLDQQPRSADVIAKCRSVVAVIPAMDLWNVIHRRPDIGTPVLFNIGRVLAGRLRSSQIR